MLTFCFICCISGLLFFYFSFFLKLEASKLPFNVYLQVTFFNLLRKSDFSASPRPGQSRRGMLIISDALRASCNL